MTELKILFINFQSGMCMSKGYSQYFTNGWKYIFPHNSISLNDVIEFIKKEKPDAVMFAEIDGTSWRSKNIDQVKIISEKTSLKYNHFFPTRVSGKWINQGNAIISKYELDNNTQIKLPGYGEKRYLCSSNIVIENRVVKYYTTHLSTNKQINLAQRYFIAKKLKRSKNTTILTGDFNIEKDSLEIIKKYTNMNDVDLKKTFPTWNPTKILDHIFVSNDCEVKKVHVYNEALFSDHLPIGVNIGIKHR